MKFTKYYLSGYDLIFIENEKDFYRLNKDSAKLMCDRSRGVGAEGIFTIKQKEGKMHQIEGFCKNGESMRDFSSASICASFVQFLRGEACRCLSGDEKSSFFTVFESSAGNTANVCCDMGCGDFKLKYPAVDRKTQLGNRILTLTAVNLHGIHTVHFSEDKNRLNLFYLGERTSENSLFEKRADLTLAQQVEYNQFCIDYYNKDGFHPSHSVFASVALCACKTDRCKFNEEIEISVGQEKVFAVCEENGRVIVQCEVQKVYSGEYEISC